MRPKGIVVFLVAALALVVCEARADQDPLDKAGRTWTSPSNDVKSVRKVYEKAVWRKQVRGDFLRRQQKPKDIPGLEHRRAAQQAMDDGRFEDAIADLHLALEETPGDPGLLLRLGDMLFNSKRYHEAVEAWLEGLEIYPHSMAFLERIPIGLAREGLFHEAVTGYERLLEVLGPPPYDKHLPMRINIFNGDLGKKLPGLFEKIFIGLYKIIRMCKLKRLCAAFGIFQNRKATEDRRLFKNNPGGRNDGIRHPHAMNGFSAFVFSASDHQHFTEAGLHRSSEQRMWFYPIDNDDVVGIQCIFGKIHVNTGF